MFEAWGRFVYRRSAAGPAGSGGGRGRRGAVGTGVFGALQSGGGFTAPGSESERAGTLATRAFGRDIGRCGVLYRSPALTVRDPAYRAAVTQSLAALPTDKVLSYQTYWSTGSPLFAGASAARDLRGAPARRAHDDAAADEDLPGRSAASSASAGLTTARWAGRSRPSWRSTIRSRPTSAEAEGSPCRCCSSCCW